MALASAQQSAALTFNLFGRPRLMVNRREIGFQRRQPLAILAVLALGERPFSRDELTYLLWPDAAQEVARQRLRRSLSELRHAVGPQAAALLLGSDASSRLALSFNHSICQVDAQAFLRLAHYADASPDPDGLRAAEQAAQIGNAPLLVGLELNGTPEFEHWLREQREHFDRLRVDVLRRMAQGYAALRDYPRAMAAVQQALTLDQWSEDLHRKAIWLFAALDRREDAVRQFAWCATLLERELAIEPDPRTHALHQAVLDGRHTEVRALAFESSDPSSPVPMAQAQPPAFSLPTARVLPGDLLDQMAAALGSALEGAPCVVCVQGPAGAGKNAALQEAILRLKQQRSELDVWILSGRVSGADAPLGLMRDLLQTALRAWLRRNAGDATPGETARRVDARINEAVRLLPELRAAFGELQPLPLQPSPDETAALPLLRRRLFHALLHAIQTLTEGQPVVVVLNDLDDADDGSKEAVAWWLHMLVGSAPALALTFRQPPAALEPVLAELRARDALRLWTAPALAHEAVLDIARQHHLSAEMAGQIHQRSGGALRAVQEMLRATLLSARFGQPVVPASMPASMDEAIQITLSALDPVARQALEASAVLGNVTAHWLQHIISHEAREVERACDLLTDYGWFEFFGERYALAVPEVREIVLAGLTPARRQRLHAQAADLLSQHSADPRVIARHLELAEQGDRAAEMWLQAARRARAVYAIDEGLAAVRRGLALTNDAPLQFALLCQQDDLLNDARRADEQAVALAALAQLLDASPERPEWQTELHRRRGRHALARNAWAEAVDALQRAAACTLHRDGETLRLLARALGQSRRWDEADAALRQAFALAQQQADAEEQARCWLLQAEIGQWRERHDDVEAALRQAVEVAGPRSPLLPQLMLALGNLASVRNDFSAALTYGQEARRIFAQRGAPDAEAGASLLVARMCVRLERLPEALDAYQAAYASYAAIDLRQGMAASRVNAATLALRMSDLAGGIALAREAHDLFQAIQDLRGVCIAASNIGVALLWMGNAAAAEPWLRQAYEGAMTLDLQAQKPFAMANLGAAWLSQGRLQEARQIMEEGLALRQAQGLLDVSLDRAFLTIACLRLGDLEAAEQYSAQAVADLERLPQVEHPQQVWFARAQALRARQLHAEAAAALEKAYSLLLHTQAALPMPWREAYLATFAFNAAIWRARQHDEWPDPPALI